MTSPMRARYFHGRLQKEAGLREPTWYRCMTSANLRERREQLTSELLRSKLNTKMVRW